MKVLITGVNSFIGNHLAEWMDQFQGKYDIDKISVKDDRWRDTSFSKYDSIVHVAGIAHVSTDPKMEELYYKVNRDLTYELAEKAKQDGVKQFIFLSSIIVYGDAKNESVNITEQTEPTPSNFYGGSKLQAEELITELADGTFKVAIIRPPMVYGKGSKGNYPKLSKMAQLLPVFPNYDNKRSMIHIDNLTELIRLIIDNQDEGMFYPQNREYVQTSELFRLIRKAHGKNTYSTKLFNGFIHPLVGRVNLLNKVFGNLTYDLKISDYAANYRVHSLEESINRTES